MEQLNKANTEWQSTVERTYKKPHYISNPRGMEVHERLGDGYTAPMPAYIDLVSRKVNAEFMFGEAAWVTSGSNRLDGLTPYMKSYANYSDDGETLSGAYGVKVVEQLNYVVSTIINDNDTRQAVIDIWRERPGPSKDIPCTLSMQFLLRKDEEGNNRLNNVVTMRSNDIVLGYTYDVFTFSMVANSVRLLLQSRGIDIPLDDNGNFGDLFVNPGSLHIYERHYDKVDEWLNSSERDKTIGKRVMEVMKAESYKELIEKLKEEAGPGKP